MNPAAPLVVLIDDEPQQHRRIAALLPEVDLVSCYTATQAIARCAALRRQDARVALVLIDFRLPDFDGALLAAAIRTELPDVPFAPFSALRQSAALIGISGTIPFPPKGADDQTLGRALRGALAAHSAIRPDPVVQAYLAEHASAYAMRQPAGLRVALLTGSRAVLGMLAAALQADAVRVAAQGTSDAALRPLLALQPVDAIVADAPRLPAARDLAAPTRTPLLCVTLSLSQAASLTAGGESLLVDPAPGALAAALAAIAAGDIYRDPQLEHAYAALGLTANERAILPYVLNDAPPAAAAQALCSSATAYGRARLRLIQRLGAAHLGEVRTHIDRALG